MTYNVGFEIPREVRNIKHDFRIAIHSFTRPFTDVHNFSFGKNVDKANLIISPEGVTNVTFGCSTNSVPQSGEFTLVGGLVGQEEINLNSAANTSYISATGQIAGLTSTTNSDTSSLTPDATPEPVDSRIPNKIAAGIKFSGEIENRTMDLGAMFSNTNQIVKPMDYVVIYTKDVRTNMWYGSKQTANTDVPEDALPKFIGIVREIHTEYNATTNRMEFTIRFNTLLRLVELARYSMEFIMYPILETITGKKFGEFEQNVLRSSKAFYSVEPHQIVQKSLQTDYPFELLGNRIEEDQLRGEIQSLSFELLTPKIGQGDFNYDTKLNKLRQLAVNKDFEFYTEEEGQLVWKLPTYARGINVKDGNKATSELFNPDDPNHDGVYHIHDFISINIQQSENEIINVMSGPNDFAISGTGNMNFNAIKDFRFTYFIKGGKDTPLEREMERRFGFLDVGVRPMPMQNPLGYNLLSKDPQERDLHFAQMVYYDFKMYKNNIGRYITATLTMIDDPRIKCGMPIVIPLLAECGRGKVKGKIIPSIFYIAATQRRYEYQKAPILVLTLTHGRFIDEEFHNGIHLFGRLSSWMSRVEPELVYNVGVETKKQSLADLNTGIGPLVITNTTEVEAARSTGNNVYYDLKNVGPNDERVREVMDFIIEQRKKRQEELNKKHGVDPVRPKEGC